MVFFFSKKPSIGGVTENTTQPSNPAIISIKPTILGVTQAIATYNTTIIKL